ncbi:DUF6864 domain-containing function, partial [Haliangium sp. UPWRP_2]|uniref:DUF6864 domain-containing function n=1 Tax=Haliangium sp. UPWRP_2 TaxID=1931276 RepID=UPI001E5005CC
MIKIGKKTVLYTTTILAADNESVLVKTTSDPSLQFSIVFVPDLDTSGNASFAWAIEQGILSLKCYGWRNPIGTHLTEP